MEVKLLLVEVFENLNQEFDVLVPVLVRVGF